MLPPRLGCGQQRKMHDLRCAQPDGETGALRGWFCVGFRPLPSPGFFVCARLDASSGTQQTIFEKEISHVVSFVAAVLATRLSLPPAPWRWQALPLPPTGWAQAVPGVPGRSNRSERLAD